jgi:spectinomycin phosphotransferase
MKSKADINSRQMGRWLVSNYDLKPQRARFLPYGECGWIYLIDTESSSYILKLKKPGLCDDSDFNEEIIKTHMALYYDYGIRQINEPPMRANTGQYINDLEGYDAILLPYIDGTPACDAELSDLHQRKLGSLIATLHRCKLHDDEVPPMETFSVRLARLLGSMLRDTAQSKENLPPIQQHLIDVLHDNYPKLKKMAAQFAALAQVLREDTSLAENFVLCHSDPSCGNIIISPDDNVYLIDWDTPIMAPPERDLFHLRQWPAALENYKSMMDSGELDKRVMLYYQLEWDIQEIVDYGRRLLYSDQSDDQNEHDWSELATHMQGIGLL